MKPIPINSKKGATIVLSLVATFLVVGYQIGIVYAVAPTTGWTLANNISINWKNAAGTVDIGIAEDASNFLSFFQPKGTQLFYIRLGSIASPSLPAIQIETNGGMLLDASGDLLYLNFYNLVPISFSGDNSRMGTGGLFTKYGGSTVTGQGFSAILGSTSQRSETGADTNVLTVTPPSAVGSYRICITMDVSAANTATLGWTATWTDSNGQAQAPTNIALFKDGTAAPALTFTAAANDAYSACMTINVNNAGTNIVVKTTFSGTSITYKVSATIERMS